MKDWETECPTMEDRRHCAHWYYGDKCCSCGAPAMTVAERIEQGSEMEGIAMDFGTALQVCKAGRKIQRSGWNGKGMYIVYQKAYPEGIPINENTAQATGKPLGTICIFKPYLMMQGAYGEFFPWNPNQLDMLSEDWQVVE